MPRLTGHLCEITVHLPPPVKGTVTQNIFILKYDYIQCVDVCMLCALKSLVGKLLAICNFHIFL